MSEMYQVIKTVPNLTTSGTKIVNEGFFRYKSDAVKTAKAWNDSLIRMWVKDASRMTGTVRGVNAQHFSDTLDKICNPPFSVKKHYLQN